MLPHPLISKTKDLSNSKTKNHKAKSYMTPNQQKNSYAHPRTPVQHIKVTRNYVGIPKEHIAGGRKNKFLSASI